MAIRVCESLAGGDFPQLKKDWTRLEKMPPHLIRAFVAAEDQRYFSHSGFDWKAIRKAFRRNRSESRMRGGSTITQQTAKNVFVWPQRSWVRKGLETYFTLLIEAFWSKRRIMEVYLNVAELGDGIYGVEAAARHYFDRPAHKLTREQSALLAAVLPNPLRWSAARPTPYIRERQRWILRQMQWVRLPEKFVQ